MYQGDLNLEKKLIKKHNIPVPQQGGVMLYFLRLGEPMKTNQTAQSTIDYLLMVTAVIVVLFFVLRPGGIYHKALNGTYKSTQNFMTQHAVDIFTSTP